MIMIEKLYSVLEIELTMNKVEFLELTQKQYHRTLISLYKFNTLSTNKSESSYVIYKI